MMQSPFSPEQIAELEQPLDPRRVKHRAGGGGMQLSYLKGHDIIDTANRIFGFGGWGYDLLGVEFNSVAADNGEVVGGYYAARVKLTVAGCVPITEEGVCPVQEGRNPRARIDAHDMARKGAITDALKRALRCFGDQFGNSLYDTDLVDGQPRPVRTASTNGNGNSNGNGSRPAATPAARPVSNGAASVPPPAPAPISPATNGNGASKAVVGDAATEQQRQFLRKLAAQQEMSIAEVQAQAQTLFGRGVEALSKSEASHLIKVLQGAAA